jgi:hypothetical protein
LRTGRISVFESLGTVQRTKPCRHRRKRWVARATRPSRRATGLAEGRKRCRYHAFSRTPPEAPYLSVGGSPTETGQWPVLPISSSQDAPLRTAFENLWSHSRASRAVHPYLSAKVEVDVERLAAFEAHLVAVVLFCRPDNTRGQREPRATPWVHAPNKISSFSPPPEAGGEKEPIHSRQPIDSTIFYHHERLS